MSASYPSSSAFIDPAPESGALLTHPLASLSARGARGDENATVLLRTASGKPLRLQAELLAEGSSRASDAPLWHEVSLYRTRSGQIALALRCVRASDPAGFAHRALVFDDMDAAATWLEQFDPTVDVNADFDVADTRLSSAAMALKAASLRDRTERLERAYRALIGEVLFRLETDFF